LSFQEEPLRRQRKLSNNMQARKTRSNPFWRAGESLFILVRTATDAERSVCGKVRPLETGPSPSVPERGGVSGRPRLRFHRQGNDSRPRCPLGFGRLQIIFPPFLKDILGRNVISHALYIIYYIYNMISLCLFAKKYFKNL
jgi:hypothetical protein